MSFTTPVSLFFARQQQDMVSMEVSTFELSTNQNFYLGNILDGLGSLSLEEEYEDEEMEEFEDEEMEEESEDEEMEEADEEKMEE